MNPGSPDLKVELCPDPLRRTASVRTLFVLFYFNLFIFSSPGKNTVSI